MIRSISIPPIDSHVDAERTAAIEDVVDHVFRCLSDADIPYCILRNRDIIPKGLEGWNDIDVLVPASAKPEVLASLFEALAPAQIGHLRVGHVSFFFPVRDVYLRIDVIYGDPSWKTIGFIDHQHVLANRRTDRGYAVAAPLHQAYIVLFSKLLWEGSVPSHYHSMISDAARQAPDVFRELITSSFGEDMADRLVTLALANQVATTATLATALRRALVRRELRHHPVRTSRRYAGQVRHGLAQRIRPSGLYVALLGPDGAGKTSVATAIAHSRTRQVAFKRVQTRLGYRQTLPPIRSIASAILRRPVPPDSSHLDPHGASPHHPIAWLLKFGYYTLDQWVEQIWIRRETAHTSLILKDRHLIELTIDPRRYRFEGPSVLTRVIARLQPEPMLLIVLDAPTEVLRSRKQEVTVEETARQRAAYREYAEHHPRGFVVNADQPMEDVIRDVLRIINEYAARQTRRRYTCLAVAHHTDGSSQADHVGLENGAPRANGARHVRAMSLRELSR